MAAISHIKDTAERGRAIK